MSGNGTARPPLGSKENKVTWDNLADYLAAPVDLGTGRTFIPARRSRRSRRKSVRKVRAALERRRSRID